MLEASLGKDWHLKPRPVPNPSGDDLPFELVELAHLGCGQRREGDRFGDGNDAPPGKGAKSIEAIAPQRSIRARVGPALSPRIGPRMLELADAPALLIQHRVVQDADDRQLLVFVDRIVL